MISAEGGTTKNWHMQELRFLLGQHIEKGAVYVMPSIELREAQQRACKKALRKGPL